MRGTLLTMLLPLTLGACVVPDDLFERGCADYTDEVEVAGAWTLTADGSRGQCVDRAMDGELTLRSDEAFAVATTAATDDAGAAVTGLILGDAYPIDFTGEVEGRCVRFRIAETTETGTARYRFNGRSDDGRMIYGSFHGEGPGACVSRGSFEVRIE